MVKFVTKISPSRSNVRAHCSLLQAARFAVRIVGATNVSPKQTDRQTRTNTNVSAGYP